MSLATELPPSYEEILRPISTAGRVMRTLPGWVQRLVVEVWQAGQLLAYLISQAYIPEHQVRWRWTKNSVAIWDNRCTQHYAVMDYPPCHRKMERAGIIGDVPY